MDYDGAWFLPALSYCCKQALFSGMVCLYNLTSIRFLSPRNRIHYHFGQNPGIDV